MTDKKQTKETIEKKSTCGIIMPISQIENCGPEHWGDVLGILKDVCNSINFESYLVSDADDIGIIHNRIIENIYSSDIVICDVSCKNANVMFELGMRLAFDKPTIIIKDDLTGYSFDTSLIEHLEYPRDLRFTSILKFKDNLSKKIKATYEKSQNDPNYSTFLKNFGKYKIAHLEDREVTSETYLLNAIEDLKRDVRLIRNTTLETNKIEHLVRARTFEDLSSEEKELFKTAINTYIEKNNMSRRPKEIDMELDEMINELQKDRTLRRIAGDPISFRQIVINGIYK